MARILFYYFPLREGLVNDGKPQGGSLVQTLVWMQNMHKLNHEIFHIKCESDTRILKSEFNWAKELPIYHQKKFKKMLVWFTYRFPKIYVALKRNKIDLVYFSMPHWSIFFISSICKLTGTKLALRIANDKNLDKSLANDHNFINNYFRDLGIKSVDFVFAQNSFQYKLLKEKLKVKNVLKISNPINIDIGHLKQKTNFEGYIAWVANFRHQKNLKLLFKVASAITSENFKIAGQALEPMDSETSQYLNKLKLLPNVEFVGVISRADIFDFLSKARFLLSTSRYEGFSNTFLESMVVGTPILTTYAVNPDEIFTHNKLGYLYSDIIELKTVLQNVTTNEYIQLSKNCIEYVQENHDGLKLTKKMLDFFSSITYDLFQ